MTTKHAPATPLPWESGMVEHEPHTVAYYSIGQARNQAGFEVAMTLNGKPRCGQDAAYIAHACNSYPRLVAAIQNDLRAYLGDFPPGHAATKLRDLLRELGEL